MAWRASYTVLLEIFPQVDARLIKAAALDHGEDIGSAADFILNEGHLPEDETSEQEQQMVSAYNVKQQKQMLLNSLTAHNSLGISSGTGERPLAGDPSDGDLTSQTLTLQTIQGMNDSSESCANDRADCSQDVVRDLPRNSSEGGAVVVEEDIETICPVVSCGGPEFSCTSVDSGTIDSQQYIEMSHILINGEPKEIPVPIDRTSVCSAEDIISFSSRNELDAEGYAGENRSEAAMNVDDTLGLLTVCVSKSLNVQEDVSRNGTEDDLDKMIDMPSSDQVGCTYTDAENLNMEDLNLRDEELEQTTRDSVYDSILISRLRYEDETVIEEDNLEILVSTKPSFYEDDEIDGGCWETVSNESTQMVSMEILHDGVEQAKSDKEVLISRIEELRALRQKTEESEIAARTARDGAAKGGLDVMAKVEEMREMLSRAREANEMRAAEVHGEKAVLATEARELQARIQQLKTEKENALSVLHEIKVSLQGRIDKACQEREAAITEKAAKEAFARDCLSKEEALMTQVAQESRELQAETESCNMLREFLIERGNIVDALQGEVAVLCEDAEELKDEIERMNLSSSSGFVHMLKPRSLSDSNTSQASRSSKPWGDRQTQILEDVDQPEFPRDSDFSANYPARLTVAGQRTANDKSWSPLPSLRRALSGSQDLSGSSHSSATSMTGTTNSATNNTVALKVSNDLDDGGAQAEDKFSSTRSSPSVSETEREVYEAQMAIFPNEEVDLINYRTSNIDIFRTAPLRREQGARGASSDEDDWHLVAGSKHTSSESSCSSYAGK